MCWGDGLLGQLGDGAYASAPIPRYVRGITTAIGISAGGSHSCALLANRRIECWGYGFFGQLGDGRVANEPTPVAVRGT